MQAEYYDEYSRMEREHWWFQARQQIIGQLLDRIIGRRGMLRILDLGCGTGESVRHLSKWGRVVGLDCSSLALDHCRRGGLERLVQGDAVRLPFADSSFDLICALDILEHLDDDSAALAEIWRVCRPDGHVLLMAPALPILWSEHDELNHHHRRYRKKALKALVETAGLECGVLSYFNTLLFPPVLAARLIRRCLRWTWSSGPKVSDFSYSGGGPLRPLLRRVFAMEGSLIGRVRLPVGVSLMCLAHRPPLNAPLSEAARCIRRLRSP